uniref:DNA replication complex GINS protein SLD5 n=1 Tax=Peronospora matthiolae TaxID=2874970 RepID=A0AAV1UNJ7_9STRA
MATLAVTVVVVGVWHKTQDYVLAIIDCSHLVWSGLKGMPLWKMSSQPEFNPEHLNEDVVRMRTLWVNELHAPEILQYSDEMVSEMLEQIRNQQEYVDSMNEDRDQLTEQKCLVNKLYQMEIDRLRYMVSSYLRTRLRKIEKFAFHLLEDDELMQRLSVKERSFAQQFMMLYESHVNDLALSKLDEESRSLSAEGMVLKPNLDGFVFCQGKDAGGVQCDDKGASFVQVASSDRYVLRYRSVQAHVESGAIELI